MSLHTRPSTSSIISTVAVPLSNTGESMDIVTLKESLLRFKALDAFEELNISPIPEEWIKYGLIIINNKTNLASSPIGAVLLRKLDRAGVIIKTAIVSANPGNSSQGKLILKDSKIRAGRKQVSHQLGDETVDFPAATMKDLETMPIYASGLPGIIVLDDVETEILSSAITVYEAMATHVADAIQALDLETQVRLAASLAKKGLKTNKKKKDDEPHVIKVVPQNARARSYGEATFTFHSRSSCCVTTTRERWVNAKLDLAGKVYDGSTMLVILLMSMTSERLVTQRQIDGWLSSLSSLWTREDNYGATLQYEDVLSFVIRNSHKTLDAVACLADDKQRYPHFALSNAKFNNMIMGEYLGNAIPVITDKYGMERLIFGAGARAMMIDSMPVEQAMLELAGFAEWADTQAIEEGSYVVLMPHDVAKGAGKLLNRPGNAFGASFADSWSDQHPLVGTALRIFTEENEAPAIFRGFKIRMGLTNSLFGNGSGVASCRRGFARPVAVGKSLSGSLTAIEFPAVWQHHLMMNAASNASNTSNDNTGNTWLEEFIPTLEAKCKELVGQFFAYGDEVLVLWDGTKHKRTLIKMDAYNQEVKVNGYKVTRLGTSNTLQVTLDVQLQYAGNDIKWRGPGEKATTCVEDIYFDDAQINNEWEMFFPYEALKGRLAQVFMYANAMEELGYTSLYKRGKVVLSKEGVDDIISDLSITKSHFETWVRDNTRLVTVTRSIERSHYNTVLASNNGVLPHVKVLGESNDEHGPFGESGGYVVEEQVQILFGDCHFQCEISTARESTSTQSLLLESVACLSMIDMESGRTDLANNLGMRFWADSAQYRDGIVSAVNMTFGSPEGTPILTIDDHELFLKMRTGKNGETLTGRDLLRVFSKKFPDGFVISTSGEQNVVTNTFIKPDAFMSLASFGTGGTASGIALDVSELLHFMASSPGERISGYDSAIHGLNSRVKAGLETWMGRGSTQGTVNSKSVLKRLGRTKKLQISGKIQTNHNPYFSHYYFMIDEEGNELDRALVPAARAAGGEVYSIPTAVLHPDCHMIAIGNIKEGDIIALTRTPMVSPVFCRVKISADHGLIGYVSCLPEVWAKGNEGDADGDGCAWYSMPADINYYWASKFNESLLSMGGYAFVYGDPANQPFADFVSVDDAWNKKLICDAEGLVPQSILDHFGGKVKAPSAILQLKTDSYLTSTVANVGNHYRRWVGTAYGWCSMLSFKSAEMMFTLYRDVFDYGLLQKEDGGMGLNEEDATLLAMRAVSGNFSDLADGVDEVIIGMYNNVQSHIQACVMAWRLAYEGLGLAGYSAEATAFFQAMDVATSPGNKTKFMVTDASEMIGSNLIVSCTRPSPYAPGIPVSAFIQNHFPLFGDKNPIVAQILAECEDLRRLFRRVERQGLEGSAQLPEFNEAMMWCALRRTTQGDSVVSFLDDSGFDGEGGRSGFRIVKTGNLQLVHPVLNDAMQLATNVHCHLSDMLFAKDQEDNSNPYN